VSGRFPALAVAGCCAASLFATPPAAAQRGGNAAGTSPVTAVTRLLENQQQAWNRGDLAGFMDGYWNSDSLTFYSAGEVKRGWREAYDRYIQRFQAGGQEMGHLDFELHTVTALTPDFVLVKGAWFLKRSMDAPHGLFTLLVRRFPVGGWRIVHDHTSQAE
jgi:ketosteroid isomerase-like protein